jgi:hypothetical protein
MVRAVAGAGVMPDDAAKQSGKPHSNHHREGRMSEISSSAKTIDIRALLGTRESTACVDGGMFPVLAATSSGTVVAALRGGAGHLGRAGRVDLIRSLDRGRTWTPPAVIADSDRDDRNPAFGVTPNGTLVLAYIQMGCYAEDGSLSWVSHDDPNRPIDAMVTRSFDNGLSWENPYPIDVPESRTDCPFGKIVTLADGSLLMSTYLYGDPSAKTVSPFVLRSTDDGRTWGERARIANDMNETGLLALPNGEVLAVMRGSGSEASLWSTRSADAGKTWSVPERVTEDRKHPADLVLLSDGSVLLCYGNRTPPYRIEGRLSRDGGRSWLEPLLTFSGPLYGYDLDARHRTDLGYPSTVIVSDGNSNRAVTVYYYNASVAHGGGWREEGSSSPFYSASNYRAIAISWDERELLDAIE